MLDASRSRHLASLESEGIIRALIDAGLLAPFEMGQSSTADGGHELSIDLRLAETVPSEWCAEAWHAGSLLLLRLLGALAQRGLTLRYLQPWHVQLDGAHPTYVNPGAITPFDSEAFEISAQRLCRFFVWPLVAARESAERRARLVLRDLFGTQDPWAAWPAIAGYRSRWFAPAALANPVDWCVRTEGEVARALTPARRETDWTAYGGRREAHLKPRYEEKARRVLDMVDASTPSRVLDLGCSTGWLTMQLASRGHRCVAVDADSECINRLFRAAAAASLPITPLVMDLLDPTPPSGPALDWTAAACERLASDCTLALALTHHLTLGAGLSFDEVARQLAGLTRRSLIVEFVPLDGTNPYRDHPRARGEWYSATEFINALHRIGTIQAAVDSGFGGRSIFSCRRHTAVV